ncbi:MAG: CPBP family intramembrane glutamic endopeptidase [Brumimicrobium sp.]
MNNKAKVDYYPNILQSLGIVGIAILLMIIFSPVNVILNDMVGNELSFLLYYLLSFGTTLGIAHWQRRKITSSNTYDLSFGSIQLMTLISLSTIGIYIGIAVPIVNSLHMPEFMQEIMLQLASQKGIFSFITIVIAAPLIEEFIFRGIILDGLLRKHSPIKSILISSILFGIVHLNPWQFISALILGVFSGWVYYRTRKLIFSILIHSVNNLIGFISFYLIDMETIMDVSIFEFYGGIANMAIIISVAIIVAIVGIYLSNKEMMKINIKGTK